MTEKIKRIIADIKRFAGRPKPLSIITILAVLAATLVVAGFHLPWYLSTIIALLFVSLAGISITGQIKAEKTKEEWGSSFEKLEKIMTNMEEGVVIYSSDFKVTKINPAAEEILEIKSEDAVSKTISPEEVNQNKTRLLAQVIFPSMAPIAKRIKTEQWPHIIELETENPDKKLLTITAKIEVNGSEKFIKIIKDKTREREIQESKNEFISTTAHQLRTPINGISWAFENIQKSLPEDSEIQQTVQEGLNLSNRSLRIINDLLAVTEIEGQRQEYEKEKTDINQLIREVVQQTKSFANEYGIEIKFNPKQQPPVLSNKSKTKAVLSTLLENAVVYNREGGEVEISTAVQNSHLRVEISDTGVGIPEEELDSLFEKFYRGEEAKKIQPNGSGLGLYIAKKIINRQGGRIWAESQKGRGSTFYFTLPLAQENSPETQNNRS